MIDKKISSAELKAESSSIKQLHNLRVVFVRLTNTNLWEDAGNKFPEVASDGTAAKVHSLGFREVYTK